MGRSDAYCQSILYSSLHCFEGPEWSYLKRGREKFTRGPHVRADPLGRCAGVLLYDSQLVLMKAAQVGASVSLAVFAYLLAGELE